MRSTLFAVVTAVALVGLYDSSAHACGMPMRFVRDQVMVAKRIQKAQEQLDFGQAQKAMRTAIAARDMPRASASQKRMASQVAGMAAFRLSKFGEAEKLLASAGGSRVVLDTRAEALVKLGRMQEARDTLQVYAELDTLSAKEKELLAAAASAPTQGVLLARQP